MYASFTGNVIKILSICFVCGYLHKPLPEKAIGTGRAMIAVALTKSVHFIRIPLPPGRRPSGPEAQEF
jgi:hypothetical protein